MSAPWIEAKSGRVMQQITLGATDRAIINFEVVCRADAARFGRTRNDSPPVGENERMSKLDLYLLMLGFVLLFLWLIAWLLG